MATHPASTYRRPVETDSGVLAKVAVLLLGFLVAVLGFFALLMWADARDARDDARTAAAQASQPSAHGDATAHNTALPLNSFAGVVPEEAQELAEATAGPSRCWPTSRTGCTARSSSARSRSLCRRRIANTC